MTIIVESEIGKKVKIRKISYVVYYPIINVVQGVHSGCFKPSVDTKTKVAFLYMGLIPKWNFCFDVNQREV